MKPVKQSHRAIQLPLLMVSEPVVGSGIGCGEWVLVLVMENVLASTWEQ